MNAKGERAGLRSRLTPDWLSPGDLLTAVVACLDLVALAFVLSYDDQQWWTWTLAGLLIANGVALVGARELGELVVALTAVASIVAVVATPIVFLVHLLGWF